MLWKWHFIISEKGEIFETDGCLSSVSRQSKLLRVWKVFLESRQLKKHLWISDVTGVSLGLQLPCALPQ